MAAVVELRPAARTSALMREFGQDPPVGVSRELKLLSAAPPGRLRRALKDDQYDDGRRELQMDIARIGVRGANTIVQQGRDFDEMFATLRADGADTSAWDARRAVEAPAEDQALRDASSEFVRATHWRNRGLRGASAADRVQRLRDRYGAKGGATIGFLPGALIAGVGMAALFTHAADLGSQPADVNGNDKPQTITVPVGAPTHTGTTSENAFSSGFHLSPTQREADVRADTSAATSFVKKVRALVERDGDRVKKVSVTVTGWSSPESANPHQDLTQTNPDNERLATERAVDGRRALVRVLHAPAGEGSTISPSSIDTVGIDRVLHPGEETTVEAIAHSRGVTPNEVITVYNGQARSSLDHSAINALDKIIPKRRGVEYTAVVEKYKKNQDTGIVSTIDHTELDGLPLKWLIGGLIALKTGLATSYISMDRLAGRIARRRARSEIEKIGREQKRKQRRERRETKAA